MALQKAEALRPRPFTLAQLCDEKGIKMREEEARAVIKAAQEAEAQEAEALKPKLNKISTQSDNKFIPRDAQQQQQQLHQQQTWQLAQQHAHAQALAATLGAHAAHSCLALVQVRGSNAGTLLQPQAAFLTATLATALIAAIDCHRPQTRAPAPFQALAHAA